MIYISLYFCSVLFTQSIHSLPSSNRHERFQIDDFISQLMNSAKFTELADDIAERAARKIKTAENSVISSRHSNNDANRKNKQKTEKEKQALRNSPERNGDKKTVENNGKKFGEINTKAFLKPDLSSQELSLNYKHMTNRLKANTDINEESKEKPDDIPKRSKMKNHGKRGIKLSQNSKEHSTKNYHSKEKSKHASKEDLNSSKEATKDSNETKKKIKMKSTVEENLSQEHQLLSDKYSPTKNDDSNRNLPFENQIRRNESSHGNSEEVDRSNEKIESSSEKSIKKPKMNAEMIKKEIDDSASDTSNDDKDTVNVKNEKDSNENRSNRLSKEIVEVSINRAISDDSNESQDEKVVIFSPRNKESRPIIKKPIVRRENGKLYTYISSPDYEEYHENVAKSNHNFINTYK